MRRVKLATVLAMLNAVLLGAVLWQAHLLRQRGNRSEAAAPEGRLAVASPRSPSSSAPEKPAVREGPGPGPAMPSGKPNPGVQPLVPRQPSFAATNRPAPDWRQVESEDYRTYVKNLRSIGCPEATIRDIVSADVLAAFAAKRAEALADRYRDFKYWQADPSETAARGRLEQQQRAVDADMAGLLQELLGPDYAPPLAAYQWKAAELDQQLAFLPADKQTQTRATLLQYAQIDQQVKELASGMNLTENLDERQKIMDTYDQEREALKARLTPEEYQQVELTTSWTSDNLRRALTHFLPTEAEFGVLFEEWQAYDEKLARLHAAGQPDPGNLREPLYENLRKRLGEKRYQDFQNTWWK